MSEPTYIYRVSFENEPAGDNVWTTDYFFGSLSAIYDTLTAEQIGCKVSVMELEDNATKAVFMAKLHYQQRAVSPQEKFKLKKYK